MARYRLTVGDDASAIRGFTNTHIQCALDRVAWLGGGEVELSAGVFHLADAVHLRSGVTLRGQGATTVLRKNAMKSARLTCFHGYGHTDVCVDAPDTFTAGEGVYITDRSAFGFYANVATLIEREGDVWYIDRPHPHDYHGSHDGRVYTLFPLISAYDTARATVEALTLDGNKAENPVVLNGCRGGGVFALRCSQLTVRGLIVRDVNTEGISFQTCDDTEIDDCLVEDCTGNGLHPGSGSNRFHIHDCIARRNGASGLFYCLRVRESLLEDCLFEENGEHGVSTGARDTDNLNRGLTLRRNGGCGFYFREEEPANAPHRNLIAGCTFTENCRATGAAELLVQGAPADVVVTGNTLTRRPGVPALLLGPRVPAIALEDNAITPAGADAVVDQRGKPVNPVV